MGSEVLAAALRYAERGWPVFPCRPDAKTPLGRAVPHGCLDASTDPATVTSWWSQWPACNLAIATGMPGPDVIDIDTKRGAPGPATFARLRDAGLLRGAFAVVTTPSGGWHLYYAGTGQGNATRAGQGIDYRGAGGYVLAPPSIVDGGAYEVAEYREPTGQTVDWAAIREFLDPPRPPRQYRRDQSGNFGALVRWLEDRPAGDRNSPLYWAALRAVEAGAGDDVLDQLLAAIVRAGHNPGEAQRTIQSAQRRAGAR